MGELGLSIAVRGEIRSTENLTIEGQVEGLVWNDGRTVTVAPGATVTGDIFAREITVLGTVSGTMVASDFVDIRESGHVIGRVVAARFILADGGSFTGHVQPGQVYAAFEVGRHRMAERDGHGPTGSRIERNPDTIAVNAHSM